jgi:cyclopropane-fatty-acyl-phospholipid synthase
MSGARAAVERLAARAGIVLDGDRPWDIRVYDDRFYRCVVAAGSLGFGEAYVDGWWDADALDETVYRILRSGLRPGRRRSLRVIGLSLFSRLVNLQGTRRAVRNVRDHYDLGLDLYRAMLDRRMVYSCGYWRTAGGLDEAQEAKLDLVCRKVGLEDAGTLLDIGCGWGSLARYAAERYGARVTGITLSAEQAAVAREACRDLPVEIRVQDFRELEGKYDAVVSVGMFEHVGPKNHATYMDAVERCLAPGGVSLLHTITGSRPTRHGDPWIHRYIFPGGVLPALSEVASAAQERFVVEDVHNLGPDYDRTLMAWWRRFEAAWPELRSGYDERFRRLWRYYLLSCAGGFRARHHQVHQVVLTRRGTPRPHFVRAT